ncbi:MAG: MGMT family protein [Anaerolineae bacterium]|nr:MGMT family protein [Anaerolineae bacterium]
MMGFFRKVYRLVCQIPPGKVASYGDIACMLGQPRAARTVGWALHSPPAGLDVPWHRVINRHGRISTSCQEHGAGLQRALLEDEGIRFDDHDRVDWEQFGWAGLAPTEVKELFALDE